LLRLVEVSGPPLILGGLSLGAHIALRAALLAPEQIRGLVLASFPATEPGSRRSDWALGFAQAIETEGLESAGGRYVWGPSSRFDEGARAFIRRGMLEHAPHALAAILRNVLAKVPEPDELAAELRAFERPTLVIVGGEDTPALAPCERLAELLPHAELAVIPSAGHVVNLAAPDEFNRALERFIASL
jgi:pimeloyl-ACP methyl ester carboxylesterase